MTSTTRRFGQYTVGQKLGAGAAAAVYAAQSTSGKPVALKILHREIAANTSAAKMFLLAASAWGRLSHAHVVPLLDCGTFNERPYLLMAALPAGSLAAHFRQPVRMSLQHSARLLRQISGGLEYIHRQGLAHGDLKLSNILLNERRDWLLSDVGMAAVYRAAHLPYDLESAHFMPADGKEDKSADLYALAVLAYLLAVGRLPFTGETPQQLREAHLRQAPRKPSELNPALSPQIDGVLLRGLAKQADQRFVSADAFAEAFAAAVAETRPSETQISIGNLLIADNSPMGITTEFRAPAIKSLHPAASSVPQAEIPSEASFAAKKRTGEISAAVKAEQTNPITPLKRVQRERKRSLWDVIGCLGLIILALTSTFIVLNISGIGGEIINFVTGNQPVSEINGTPVDMIERPVLVVPASQSSTLRSESTLSDSLTDGHVHEYSFDAFAGDEVLIGVQFFSPTAVNVPTNVSVFDPSGVNAESVCERQVMLDAQTGIGLICRISTSGTWTLRIFGREGESTGAYAVSLVKN